MAQQAELFLRLIHNGQAVVITWPAERLGQPCLPSPYVTRLGLSGLVPCSRGRAGPLYRRGEPLLADIAAGQRSFRFESPQIPVAADSAPLDHLSHATLRNFLDCPYRFLLASGFRMREEEEVLAEFRRQDYGTFVHECLKRFFAAGEPGLAAVARGDGSAAVAELERIAADQFGLGAAEMPQRRLWQETFCALVPALVEFELLRYGAGWRPRHLETAFEFPLAALRDWLAAQPAIEIAAGEGESTDTHGGLDLSTDAAGFTVTGKIDRIDVRDDGPACAVIDYKTGTAPSLRDVASGRDLQIVLYSLAVLTGGVPGVDPGAGIDEDPGTRVGHGAYYQVRHQQVGFEVQRPHLAGGTPEGREILIQGGWHILQAAQAARDRSHPYPLIPAQWQEEGAGDLPCRYCPFLAVCRLEERDLPDHVQVRLQKELTAGRWT